MELEGLHFFTLILTAVVIIYSDHQGFLYFRGKKQTLSPLFLLWSHRLVWIGLLGMIVSGFFMVLPWWERKIQDPAFIVKMFFVLVLVINGVAIGRLSQVAATTPFASLDAKKKRILFISGAASAISWIGAATIGFLFL
jgi:hypothetical protein